MGSDEREKLGRCYSDVDLGHRGHCEDRQQKGRAPRAPGVEAPPARQMANKQCQINVIDALPALTRRRDPTRQETWLIYYDDVRAGTIANDWQSERRATMAMAMRLLSGITSGRVYGRHGGQL